MSNTVSDLYTTVKNVSGKELTFGFLGAHGVKLAADATYSVPGDLVAKLGGKRSQRQFQALERAVLNDLLQITKSPAVYVLGEEEVEPPVVEDDEDDDLGDDDEPVDPLGGDN